MPESHLSRCRHAQPGRTNSRSAVNVCAQRNGASFDWRIGGGCTLLKIHRASLNMDELREFFALFNKLALFNELADERLR
jgi:hypothetical protein